MDLGISGRRAIVCAASSGLGKACAHELAKAGCEKIIEDTASGGKLHRSGLERARELLRKGDVLVVWRLDRLGRSLKHLIELMGGEGPGVESAAREIYDEWAHHHHFSLYDDVTSTLRPRAIDTLWSM